MPTLLPEGGVATPTAADVATAKVSSQTLAPHVGDGSLRIRLKSGAGDDELVLPPAAARLLLDILTEMGRGNTVAVSPVQTELTASQPDDRNESFARRRAALNELTGLSQELGLYDDPMR